MATLAGLQGADRRGPAGHRCRRPASWTDQASREALAFTFRRLIDLPIRVLIADRSDEPGSRLPFGLGETARPVPVERLWLEPLSMGALHELLRAATGTKLQPIDTVPYPRAFGRQPVLRAGAGACGCGRGGAPASGSGPTRADVSARAGRRSPRASAGADATVAVDRRSQRQANVRIARSVGRPGPADSPTSCSGRRPRPPRWAVDHLRSPAVRLDAHGRGVARGASPDTFLARERCCRRS